MTFLLKSYFFSTFLYAKYPVSTNFPPFVVQSWAYNYTIVLKKDPSIIFCHTFKKPTHQVLIKDIDSCNRNIVWTLLLLFFCDGNLKRGYCFSITSSTDFSDPVMMLFAVIWRRWTYQSVFWKQNALNSRGKEEKGLLRGGSHTWSWAKRFCRLFFLRILALQILWH